jgi:mRNA interferase HigB
MKLISNKALSEFAAAHPDADEPLQAWRRLVERGTFQSFSDLRTTFASVDKVGDRYVFNISGNKYRLIVCMVFSVQTVWVKAVLKHADYDKGAWK